MPTYIALVNFTNEGVKTIKDLKERVGGFRDLASSMGVTVKAHYFTAGRYDSIAIIEAPDSATASALSLSIGARGNVRTESLQAFTLDEMLDIVSKMK